MHNFYPDDIDWRILSGYIWFVPYTAFHGFQKVAAGSADDLVELLKGKPQGEVIVFDDSTGSQVDLDYRGASKEIADTHADAAALETRGRGRPRLGVIAKEVTLLPRHWDWLNLQPGGASVVLRKLVDEARKTSGDRDRVRAAQEAAYRFMSAVAGNLPGFEEASRALFAYERRKFTLLVANWPEDVRDYAVKLAFADQEPAQA
jgi:uncharacterized protein